MIDQIIRGSGLNTSARVRDNIVWAQEFLSAQSSNAYVPFLSTAVASGTINSQSAVVQNHPGIIRLRCSTSANSGAIMATANNAIYLGANMLAESIFNIPTLLIDGANTVVRFGLHDASSGALTPTDGVYIEITAGVASGICRNAGTQTASGTTLTLTAATWYRATVTTSANNDSATFTIYSEAGATLWQETVSTNYPVNKDVGAEFLGFAVTPLAAADVVLIDYLAVQLPRQTR